MKLATVYRKNPINARHWMTVLCLMLLTVYSTPALATEGDVINIIYDGSNVTVDIPSTAAVTYTATGAHVMMSSTTTTEEYIYRLSGSSDDGSFYLSGNYKLTLQLNGLNLQSQNGFITGSAIHIQCGKRVAVELVSGTVNTLSDCLDFGQDAALYTKGHFEFEGSGTLNVTGNYKHAIKAKEYIEIKNTTGTINVLGAASDGIHCGKGVYPHNIFQMDGGIININGVGKDAIDADDFGSMIISGGIINATVSSDSGSGLKCDSIFTMTGGQINLVVSGQDSEGIRTNYDAQLLGGSLDIRVSGDGSKAIKSKDESNDATALVVNGGTITFGGTECRFYTHAGDLTDATTGDVTKCRAVSADKDITFNDGNVEIFAYGTLNNPFHSDLNIIENGGTLTMHRAPWKFYYGDYEQDMTAYVTLVVNDEPVASLSDYAIGAFVGDECVGIAIDDYLRIWSNTGNNDEITFRVCDLTTEKEINVISVSQDVIFSSGSRVGSYSNPVVINCAEKIIGDVNKDGFVTIADVTALVNIILGKDNSEPYLYDHEAADVNTDETITIADVTALVNIILGK
ncbi:MAG: carbohydrate-binding domain-containing protein [Prevotella sp.]|nr:carbohydrate-binding domain-containing protein [Prevotella sp.]